jgi:hypothetical protein
MFIDVGCDAYIPPTVRPGFAPQQTGAARPGSRVVRYLQACEKRLEFCVLLSHDILRVCSYCIASSVCAQYLYIKYV